MSLRDRYSMACRRMDPTYASLATLRIWDNNNVGNDIARGRGLDRTESFTSFCAFRWYDAFSASTVNGSDSGRDSSTSSQKPKV